MRFAYAAIAAVLCAAPALADDAKPMTVEQCVTILTGLTSLNYAGQQLNDGTKAPDGAKQYKLGATRYNIAKDISDLQPVLTAAQRAQDDFIAKELTPLPVLTDGAKDAEKAAYFDAVAKQKVATTANWTKILLGPCTVAPGRLKAADLNIGDDSGQNQIPPSVLAAISPIIDK